MPRIDAPKRCVIAAKESGLCVAHAVLKSVVCPPLLIIARTLFPYRCCYGAGGSHPLDALPPCGVCCGGGRYLGGLYGGGRGRGATSPGRNSGAAPPPPLPPPPPIGALPLAS